VTASVTASVMASVMASVTASYERFGDRHAVPYAVLVLNGNWRRGRPALIV